MYLNKIILVLLFSTFSTVAIFHFSFVSVLPGLFSFATGQDGNGLLQQVVTGRMYLSIILLVPPIYYS